MKSLLEIAHEIDLALSGYDVSITLMDDVEIDNTFSFNTCEDDVIEDEEGNVDDQTRYWTIERFGNVNGVELIALREIVDPLPQEPYAICDDQGSIIAAIIYAA